MSNESESDLFVASEGFDEAWKVMLACGFRKEDQAVALTAWTACARYYKAPEIHRRWLDGSYFAQLGRSSSLDGGC